MLALFIFRKKIVLKGEFLINTRIINEECLSMRMLKFLTKLCGVERDYKFDGAPFSARVLDVVTNPTSNYLLFVFYFDELCPTLPKKIFKGYSCMVTILKESH